MTAPSTIDEVTTDLARRMKAIRDPGMRHHSLARFMAHSAATDVIGVLSVALARSRDGDEGGLLIANTLAATLTDTSLLSYERRADLYAQAKTSGQKTVARLLFGDSPVGMSAREAEAAMAPERPLMPRGKPLSLGERKSLARGHRRDLLEHLLRDPHPDVVEILLGNPHITEADVLLIASRRIPQPHALLAVARSSRWRARYNVRRALVLNPNTPAVEALRIATTLRPSDLRLIAADTKLPAVVRLQATELLSTKRGSG